MTTTTFKKSELDRVLGALRGRRVNPSSLRVTKNGLETWAAANKTTVDRILAAAPGFLSDAITAEQLIANVTGIYEPVTKPEDEPQRPGLRRRVAKLKVAPVAKPAPTSDGPKEPKEGTKAALLVALMRRPGGATAAQMADAADWSRSMVLSYIGTTIKKRHAQPAQVTVQGEGKNRVKVYSL